MKMFFLIQLLATISLGVAGAAQFPFPPGISVVVPKEYETTNTFQSSDIPFGLRTPVHYQQVFDASEFTKVPQGGAFITDIYIGNGCGGGNTAFTTNLVANLSTTTKSPDGLSSRFAENVGADSTTVFTPKEYHVEGSLRCGPGFFTKSEFVSPMHLDVPFFYNPSKGNLLLDLKVPVHPFFSKNLSFDRMLNEIASNEGDAVSRIVSTDSIDSPTANVVDTAGIVSFFVIWGVPKLFIGYATNNLVLAWPKDPEPAKLQVVDQITAAAAWKDYAGTITTYAIYRQTVVTPESRTKQQFFRLYWNSPQPGIPSFESEILSK